MEINIWFDDGIIVENYLYEIFSRKNERTKKTMYIKMQKCKIKKRRIGD